MKSIVISEQARIPEWVQDHASFRRWTRSDDFPESGRFAYLNGHLWVDITMERLVHNRIKAEFGRGLLNLEKADKAGLYIVDRMLLTNLEVELSTEPDGMYVSNECLESGRAVVNEGDDAIEVIGSPDMTLEIIRPTSVQKDTVHLRRLYWEAKVREYWLVDSREKHFSFDILRHASARFVAVRKQNGWVKSQVFGREFRLVREVAVSGVSRFTLEIR